MRGGVIWGGKIEEAGQKEVVGVLGCMESVGIESEWNYGIEMG